METGRDNRMTEQTAGWQRMKSYLTRVAVGPAGSKDLSREEACDAMQLCLNGEASDIQTAVFLIAERLKRETDEENCGFFDAIQSATTTVTSPCDNIVSFADPTDGFNRAAHFAPVTAAILADNGLGGIIMSASGIPPKHGVTMRQALEHWGCQFDIGSGQQSIENAAQRVAKTGVAYVDLADCNPGLTSLTPIRVEMTKRPALATWDKLVTPIRGKKQTHIVAGWVHSGYERLISLVLRDAGFKSVLLFKGREGHCDAHAHRPTITYGFGPHRTESESAITPESVDFPPYNAPQWPEITAETTCNAWQMALENTDNPESRIVQLTAAAILQHTGRVQTLKSGVLAAQKTIKSGQARTKLNHFSCQ